MSHTFNHRIAACCQLGELVVNRKGVQEFKQFSDCSMGTVQRAAMLKILGIGKEDLHLLTVDVVQANKVKLQAKLLPVVKRNLQALHSQIKRVAAFPDTQKMFRISSDLLPLFTHLELGTLYDDSIMSVVSASLSRTGKLIRDNDIRVSSHPSQWTTLSSDNEAVIDASIRDLEHHKLIFTLMGLSAADGVVINIHANGNSFTLPERAKHLFDIISLENDEKKAGHDKVLMLCEKYGIRYVFDHHHYFCETGDYLDFNGDIWSRIKATWKGQRPIMHLSQSRGDGSFKEQCAHSDMITDTDLIEYIAPFLYEADLDVEAKHKNLASNQLDQDVQKCELSHT